LNLCECGCGQEVNNRFVTGHWIRIRNPMLIESVGIKASQSLKGRISCMKNKHHTEETRQKMRDNHIGMTGQHHSEESKKKMSMNHMGFLHSEESKKKMSLSQMGRVVSEKTKQMLSLSIKNRQWGSDNSFYGQHHTEETKLKLSNSHRGQFPSNATGKGIGSYCKKGHWVRSTWELFVADWLWDHDISYEYELERFWFCDKWSYLPDFYIPSLDLWIEVKGYMRPKNKIQIKLFLGLGYKLLILDDLRCFEQKLMEVCCD